MCPIISTEIPRDEYLKYFCKDKYLIPMYDTLGRKHSYPAMLQVLRQEAVHNEQLINMICTQIRHACTALEKQFSTTMSKHVRYNRMLWIGKKKERILRCPPTKMRQGKEYAHEESTG